MCCQPVSDDVPRVNCLWQPYVCLFRSLLLVLQRVFGVTTTDYYLTNFVGNIQNRNAVYPVSQVIKFIVTFWLRLCKNTHAL